jgi:CubicO group peptidase (beta-lactamase class C family)
MVPGFGGDGKPTAAWNFEALAGCGALRSSAADLLVLLHRLFNPKLSSLDDALLDTISVKVRCLWHSRIGLGWQDYFESGKLIHWHNGATGGFSSFVGINSNDIAAVVILANMNLISSGQTEDALDTAGLKALSTPAAS